MCMSCDVCVILLVLQILDKVSPNPAEAKAVTARKNRKKNRFDQFLPGITGRTLQISILIMNLRKPRKYDVVKSSVFPTTGNVQNGIPGLKRYQ